jgi:DeoR family transcriptional regulator, suf operon transcriptional repressor
MPDATISAAGMRIVKLLVGNPPQTVLDLIRASGVTRTAVTEQLNELEALGIIERSQDRLGGRGRPRHLYKATQAALSLLFTNNQRLVIPAIWKSLYELGGEELTQKILKHVSRQLADHYSSNITAKKPKERLRQFVDLLLAEGGLVDVVEDDNGQMLLCRRSCPFISMLDAKRSVCRIDQDILNAVVGRAVRRVACRHDGAPCCRFEIGR